MFHTDKIYEAELTELREKLLTVGGIVEQAIVRSVQALAERDSALARAVVADDRRVNLLEVEIDELCLRMLALRQPAASDLRFITIALKIVTDLERIGDLAVNVAERAIQLNEQPPVRPYVDIPRMAEIAEDMLKKALDAFVASDAAKAREVLEQDNEVDELYHMVFRELVEIMTAEPSVTARGMAILFIAKHLERIADHATNVAEMVIFYVEGRDVRHPKSRVLA
ncbi:phosphate signaling complex protein PhoU [Vulgatibacter incomptus]|uniref:Phosphate-specific transport system accessory protein PhoU n=1 Tax=Vulgatibacter incomptus TaxID=1391653 RepID=A0A0K1PEZ8_9BACT|nr:phosphate signaling complex protein PhoU [Vulgatibacter incomptus]AKU92082.1 Phosphate transport system regulatory protein PhoU [Vulgatibacter incomptus]